MIPSCLVAAEAEVELPGFSAQITTMVAALVGVIALGVLLIFILKKIMLSKVMGGSRSNAPIQVKDKRALGAKSSLYLVGVEGKSFLIAESAQTISLIASFEEKREEPASSISHELLDKWVKR
jgi:flagellar biogenesis protein FliO